MFHEFDDDFNRIEYQPAPNRENTNRANILPAKYLRMDWDRFHHLVALLRGNTGISLLNDLVMGWWSKSKAVARPCEATSWRI